MQGYEGDAPPASSQDEQAKWLQDASTSVKRNAFYMKRALVGSHRLLCA